MAFSVLALGFMAAVPRHVQESLYVLPKYEHGQYFYTIKKTSRATVIYCTDLLLEHNKKEPREQWYRRLRHRKDVYKTTTLLR